MLGVTHCIGRVVPGGYGLITSLTIFVSHGYVEGSTALCVCQFLLCPHSLSSAAGKGLGKFGCTALEFRVLALARVTAGRSELSL